MSSTKTKDESFNNDLCAYCSRPGNLLLCDICPRSFHLKCIKLNKVPTGSWTCPFCSLSKSKGTSSDSSNDTRKQTNSNKLKDDNTNSKHAVKSKLSSINMNDNSKSTNGKQSISKDSQPSVASVSGNKVLQRSSNGNSNNESKRKSNKKQQQKHELSNGKRRKSTSSTPPTTRESKEKAEQKKRSLSSRFVDSSSNDSSTIDDNETRSDSESESGNSEIITERTSRGALDSSKSDNAKDDDKPFFSFSEYKNLACMNASQTKENGNVISLGRLYQLLELVLYTNWNKDFHRAMEVLSISYPNFEFGKKKFDEETMTMTLEDDDDNHNESSNNNNDDDDESSDTKGDVSNGDISKFVSQTTYDIMNNLTDVLGEECLYSLMRFAENHLPVVIGFSSLGGRSKNIHRCQHCGCEWKVLRSYCFICRKRTLPTWTISIRKSTGSYSKKLSQVLQDKLLSLETSQNEGSSTEPSTPDATHKLASLTKGSSKLNSYLSKNKHWEGNIILNSFEESADKPKLTIPRMVSLYRLFEQIRTTAIINAIHYYEKCAFEPQALERYGGDMLFLLYKFTVILGASLNASSSLEEENILLDEGRVEQATIQSTASDALHRVAQKWMEENSKLLVGDSHVDMDIILNTVEALHVLKNMGFDDGYLTMTKSSSSSSSSSEETTEKDEDEEKDTNKDGTKQMPQRSNKKRRLANGNVPVGSEPGFDFQRVASQVRHLLLEYDITDVIGFDPRETFPWTPARHCSNCGTINKYKDERCSHCTHYLKQRVDYGSLTDAVVWIYVFDKLGIPLRTQTRQNRQITVTFDDISPSLPRARSYQSLDELGHDFWKLEAYFVTHFLYVMSDWGAHLLNRELYAEEFQFILSNMHHAIRLNDCEIIGEFVHCLRILGVCPEDSGCWYMVEYGMAALLMKEELNESINKGCWVSKGSKAYTRYHSSYCGIVGLIHQYHLLPDCVQSKKINKFPTDLGVAFKDVLQPRQNDA